MELGYYYVTGTITGPLLKGPLDDTCNTSHKEIHENN